MRNIKEQGRIVKCTRALTNNKTLKPFRFAPKIHISEFFGRRKHIKGRVEEAFETWKEIVFSGNSPAIDDDRPELPRKYVIWIDVNLYCNFISFESTLWNPLESTKRVPNTKSVWHIFILRLASY